MPCCSFLDSSSPCFSSFFADSTDKALQARLQAYHDNNDNRNMMIAIDDRDDKVVMMITTCASIS